METFNSVLDEFNINKKLITIVPDPTYEFSKSSMLEYGKATEQRQSPNGTWLLDSCHAIFSIFHRVVWAVNWKKNECEAHENCKQEMKRMIIEVMRRYQSIQEGELIPIAFIDEIMK
ncbi:hypothetical protein B9Z55_009126 [Caenorhabditis nigoni]|uniref:Uncharacterized protein n=1 Tax=Caenorhabditis nigoni TaxID=1611254 RepID=A0A2G5UQQ7_9PELO|nr:hypothetical protein B9Z55_009126 [Caenorhabditis nigoni]